jgi:hypothetical protein
MPDQLPVQPFEQASRDRLRRDLPDQPVQLVIERGVLQRLPVGDAALHILAQLAQPGRLRLGDPLGRLGRAQSFQRHPALGDGDRLAACESDPVVALGALGGFYQAECQSGGKRARARDETEMAETLMRACQKLARGEDPAPITRRLG